MLTEKRKYDYYGIAFMTSMFLTVFAIILMAILVLETQKTMYKDSSEHLDEISKQISISVSQQCSQKFNVIDILYKGLIILNNDNQLNFGKFVQDNSSRWGFEEICFIDENGIYYDSKKEIQLASNKDVSERLLQIGEPVVVDNVKYENLDMLIFAKPIDPIVIDGISIKAMGISYNKNILDIFNIDVFNGNSNLYVIHNNGDIIFRKLSNAEFNGRNLFEELGGSVNFKHGSVVDLISDIQNKSTELMTFDFNGTRYLNHKSVDGTDWTFVMTVPIDVVSGGIKKFSGMAITFSIIIAILFLITGMVLFAVRMNGTLAAKEEARIIAEQASASKSRFLSNMSHDIRTPMNAIIGMTETANKYVDNPEKVKYYLNKISMSGNLLSQIINDVLDISEIEKGNVVLYCEQISLPKIVKEIVNVIYPSIFAKKQDFSVRVKNVRHEFLYADAVKINKLFLNFLTNAVKYTPEQGKIAVDIEEILSEKENFAHFIFTFTDTGIGISNEVCSKLFDAFECERGISTNQIHGTGLGMALSRKIAQMMGGDIFVESVLGKGTIFTVDLYLEYSTAPNEMYMEFQNKRALIANTDMREREAAVGELKYLGFVTDSAKTNDDAAEMATMAYVENKSYDVIILDSPYKGLDPVVAVSMIRKRISSSKTMILIADYDSFDYRDEAISFGTNGFIAKPLFTSVLADAINRVLNDNGSESEGAQEKAYNFFGKRILIVEDNEMNCEVTADILSQTSCIVETAFNGAEAVRKYLANGEKYYDLILMDVEMPVMNGYEATRKIRSAGRRDSKDIPIFAMTANAFEEDIAESKASGMEVHLSKPLDVEAMLWEMQKYLNL